MVPNEVKIMLLKPKVSQKGPQDAKSPFMTKTQPRFVIVDKFVRIMPIDVKIGDVNAGVCDWIRVLWI